MMGNKSLLVIEERKSEAAFVHYDVTSIVIQLPKAGGPSSTNDSNTISDCGRTLQGLSSLRRKNNLGLHVERWRLRRHAVCGSPGSLISQRQCTLSITMDDVLLVDYVDLSVKHDFR